MRKAQLPFSEQLRLEELHSYHILDTDPENEFNDLAELLHQITGCSYVTITFLDKTRQWHKAAIGINPNTESDRDISFCSHTILQKDIMIVSDATTDERFADYPFVKEGLKIKFYAGMPIVSAKGQNIGTVCAFDSVAHQFSEKQQRSIEIISLQVTRLLELRLKTITQARKAEQLIEMERRTVQYTISEQEKERQSIGFELHENFAQVVAACLMYLNLADGNKGSEQLYIEKARQELSNMVTEMRKLSKTFNPVNVPYIHLEEIVKEFIVQVKHDAQFPIDFSWHGDVQDVCDTTALSLFRILTQYLNTLREQQDINAVSVSINAGKEIELQISDDGNPRRFREMENTVAFNAIINRVELCNGLFELRNQDDSLNLFKVQLPLSA